MFMGHYVTALIPYEQTREKSNVPFWVFLLASQFLDFLMLTLVALGIEGFDPHNFLDFSFTHAQTDMYISHDILPVLGWAVGFALLVLLFFRNKIAAMWCFALIIFHEVCDLVVGFKHNIIGKDTASLGMNLYNEAPVTGLFLEAALCCGIVWWFIQTRKKKGKPVSARLQWVLYLLLVGGTLATLPMANQSLGVLFK